MGEDVDFEIMGRRNTVQVGHTHDIVYRSVGEKSDEENLSQAHNKTLVTREQS